METGHLPTLTLIQINPLFYFYFYYLLRFQGIKVYISDRSQVYFKQKVILS